MTVMKREWGREKKKWGGVQISTEGEQSFHGYKQPTAR